MSKPVSDRLRLRGGTIDGLVDRARLFWRLLARVGLIGVGWGRAQTVVGLVMGSESA